MQDRQLIKKLDQYIMYKYLKMENDISAKKPFLFLLKPPEQMCRTPKCGWISVKFCQSFFTNPFLFFIEICKLSRVAWAKAVTLKLRIFLCRTYLTDRNFVNGVRKHDLLCINPMLD